jgi:hypothetical protein
MMTCKKQIDSKTFAYMKHIRPRRALVIDQQKGMVAMCPLFVHDGTRRGARPDDPPGMLQNLVTVETFGIRGGLIHEVEVFPFVTLPYGLVNGWTEGSGRCPLLLGQLAVVAIVFGDEFVDFSISGRSASVELHGIDNRRIAFPAADGVASSMWGRDPRAASDEGRGLPCTFRSGFPGWAFSRRHRPPPREKL